MRSVNPERPSPGAGTGLSMSLEDYLECVHMLGLAGRPARVRDIAAALGVRMPSVVKGVSSLKAAGYVTQEPYGSVELTPKGRIAAKKVFGRHSVLKSFLIKLGVPAKTAEADGCRMEHILSPTTFARIEAFLSGGK